jgi:hypothetical protein
MKIDVDKCEITFSTGKKVFAYRGIIGLTPCGDVTEGYDGELYPQDSDQPSLTAAECVELANHMTEQWRLFGQRYQDK